MRCAHLKDQFMDFTKPLGNSILSLMILLLPLYLRKTPLIMYISEDHGSKFIFLILYVDNILLSTNDFGLMHNTKIFLSKNFEMKEWEKPIM